MDPMVVSMDPMVVDFFFGKNDAFPVGNEGVQFHPHKCHVYSLLGQAIPAIP